MVAIYSTWVARDTCGNMYFSRRPQQMVIMSGGLRLQHRSFRSHTLAGLAVSGEACRSAEANTSLLY